MDIVREGLRLPAKAWLRLVQFLADRAASDPARRAERLERPPMFSGAHTNERWHAAEMHYRSQLHQLEQQAKREEEEAAAPWWRLFHIIYSWEMVWMLVTALLAVWILKMWDVM